MKKYFSISNLYCNKTKVKIYKIKRIHFRKKRQAHTFPLSTTVEQVNSFGFLGISITEKLSWTSHISILVKTAQK